MTYRPRRKRRTSPAPFIVLGLTFLMLIGAAVAWLERREPVEKPVAAARQRQPASRPDRVQPRPAPEQRPARPTPSQASTEPEEKPPAEKPQERRGAPVAQSAQSQAPAKPNLPVVDPEEQARAKRQQEKDRAWKLLTQEERARVGQLRLQLQAEGVARLTLSEFDFITDPKVLPVLLDEFVAAAQNMDPQIERISKLLELGVGLKVLLKFQAPGNLRLIETIGAKLVANKPLTDFELQFARESPFLEKRLNQYVNR